METRLIRNIGLLATSTGRGPARGRAMRGIQALQKAAVLVQGGVIQAVYAENSLPASLPVGTQEEDAGGRLVTPGLIDAHTHLVFGGYRQEEACRRLQGDSNADILRDGGGIQETVERTRAAGFDELYHKSLVFIWEMLQQGVTTCEIKSGYGLDTQTELKQLCVARELDARTPMDISTTYLGAHAVPPGYKGDTEAYVAFLIEQAIPAVAASGFADACDVLCGRDAFSVDQARRILACARSHGLLVKLHADEMSSTGGGALAAAIEAASADGLIAVSDESLRALARGDTIAMLLPQTSLYMDKPYAPARKMIDMDIPVALATDFNPGSCPSNNLHLSMTLAFLKYRMTPEEILTAVTRNAACALCRDAWVGTLEPGKQADLILWDAEDLATLCYRMGANLVHSVYKHGQLTLAKLDPPC